MAGGRFFLLRCDDGVEEERHLEAMPAWIGSGQCSVRVVYDRVDEYSDVRRVRILFFFFFIFSGDRAFEVNTVVSKTARECFEFREPRKRAEKTLVSKFLWVRRIVGLTAQARAESPVEVFLEEEAILSSLWNRCEEVVAHVLE